MRSINPLLWIFVAGSLISNVANKPTSHVGDTPLPTTPATNEPRAPTDTTPTPAVEPVRRDSNENPHAPGRVPVKLTIDPGNKQNDVQQTDQPPAENLPASPSESVSSPFSIYPRIPEEMFLRPRPQLTPVYDPGLPVPPIPPYQLYGAIPNSYPPIRPPYPLMTKDPTPMTTPPYLSLSLTIGQPPMPSLPPPPPPPPSPRYDNPHPFIISTFIPHPANDQPVVPGSPAPRSQHDIYPPQNQAAKPGDVAQAPADVAQAPADVAQAPADVAQAPAEVSGNSPLHSLQPLAHDPHSHSHKHSSSESTTSSKMSLLH